MVLVMSLSNYGIPPCLSSFHLLLLLEVSSICSIEHYSPWLIYET